MAGSVGTLHFICGRLASGKTTLAHTLVAEEHAILICEDAWLSKLSDEISSFDDYLKWSRRCRSVMESLVVDILRAGSSVVLDFGGNTPTGAKMGSFALRKSWSGPCIALFGRSRNRLFGTPETPE